MWQGNLEQHGDTDFFCYLANAIYDINMKWQEYDVPEKVRKFKESFSSETYLQNISSEAELQNVVLVKNRIRKKKVVDPPPPPLPPHEPIETKNERAERLRMEELADEEIEDEVKEIQDDETIEGDLNETNKEFEEELIEEKIDVIEEEGEY